MKKKLLAVLLTLCLVLGLFPIGVLAAPKDLNDTEFHIDGIKEMKALVAEKYNLSESQITIHGVEVNGTRKDKPATATGGVVDHGYDYAGDKGAHGTNGELTGWPNFWTVMNTDDTIDAETVSSITIYARKGYKDLLHKG